MVFVGASGVPLLALVLSVWVHCDNAFVVPVGRSATSAGRVSALRSSCSSMRNLQTRPERVHEVWRRQVTARRASMMAAPLPEDSTAAGISRDVPLSFKARSEPESRFGRISKRIRKIIRRAIMGYLPEEEAAADAAANAAAAAQRFAQTQVHDERFQKNAIMAKNAAEGVVAAAHGEPVAAPDIVQLDIGGTSPMEAEDMMASLRKRMEEIKKAGGPQEELVTAATETEIDVPEETEMEKQRREIQMRIQQRARERREQQEKEMLEKSATQERRERIGRPANFDGDTAVAERPSGKTGDVPQAPESQKPGTPKMASREQIERLNRMFGSGGGERLP